MRELNNTEIETVAGGEKADIGHAVAEGLATLRETGSLGRAYVAFLAHWDGSF